MANSNFYVIAVVITLLSHSAIASSVGIKTLADFIQLLTDNIGTAGTHYSWPDGSQQFPDLDNITWYDGVFEFVPGDHSHNATHLSIEYVPRLAENYAETHYDGSILSSGVIKAYTNGILTIRYVFDADGGKMKKAFLSVTDFKEAAIMFSGRPVGWNVRRFVEINILETYIRMLVHVLKDTVKQFNEPPR